MKRSASLCWLSFALGCSTSPAGTENAGGGSGGLGEPEPASWYETKAYCDGNSALVLCTGRVAVPTFLEGGGGLGPGGAGAAPTLEACPPLEDVPRGSWHSFPHRCNFDACASEPVDLLLREGGYDCCYPFTYGHCL